MRKLVAIVLIISLLVISCGCQKNDAISIGIIPLDSRPCNTQYAQLLGEMAGFHVKLPDRELLDDFTTLSQANPLWQWLEQNKCDHYILFTNQLWNGGLIGSRSLTNYADEEVFFNKLSAFIDTHKDSTITIISVLPRLLPSQYDEELWSYQKELASYGSAWDKALQLNQLEPDLPKNVPVNLVAQYRALYETNYAFLFNLSDYAKENVQLVIGQDDAQQYCPSNIIYRAMNEIDNANISMLHGADELTMLTVAKYTAIPSTLKVVYSDSADAERYYPYEAADLASIIEEKAKYVNLSIDENAIDTLIIHTSPDSLVQTKTLLEDNYNGYLALADVAYTNKGDIALSDILLEDVMFQKLHCYSGWNTASNTIGTILAHYAISQNYAKTDSAAKAALEFKLTRYSEDLAYQGHISNILRGELATLNQIDYTTAFVCTEGYANATERLTNRFTLYGDKLCDLVVGRQVLLPGIVVQCNKAEYKVSFPWDRAFEIYAQWNVTI